HPRSPRAVIADLPEYVERIIMRCLQANPSARYQSAREILRDLDAQRADSPIEASQNQTWVSGQVGDAVTASPLPSRTDAAAQASSIQAPAALTMRAVKPWQERRVAKLLLVLLALAVVLAGSLLVPSFRNAVARLFNRQAPVQNVRVAVLPLRGVGDEA